ncbi:MarR family winged helix-turn-helix transcriptional regulator [Kribbella monticola]|uniref:MarR family winged helix-turn-helix transcriptional regulator n=1 Tax=Kribbella monticola TaxID=2185285 RepID=UPI000DD4AFBE|nr:MarR family winged helix-turn-helix transcriptional regulator [Kribbella monticola]
MIEESGPMLSPGFWLHHAALAWRAELDQRLRTIGLTPTQFMLLASAGWLEHTQGAPTQQQVAAQAGADRMMTSKVVKTLVEAELLSREADPNDSRAYRLRLTTKGRKPTRQATEIARALDTEYFGDTPEALRKTFREIANRRSS